MKNSVGKRGVEPLMLHKGIKSQKPIYPFRQRGVSLRLVACNLNLSKESTL